MTWLKGKDVGQTQKGGENNTQNIGMDPALFVKEMQRKDARIDELIVEKEALITKVNDLEQQKLRAEVAELREQKQGLENRLANPDRAFAEHKSRADQIETLLEDVAAAQSLGENRIKSALEGFKNLEYEEVDALLTETADRGIMIAANAFYGKGLIAEDAIKWHDAATHYTRAAELDPTFDHLKKAREFLWRNGQFAAAKATGEKLIATAKADENQEHVADALNDHAITLNALGDYPAAETLHCQALEIDRATIGEGHPAYATHLNNLAEMVRAQGRYNEAEPLYREVLEIDRTTLREGHPDYAMRLNNLALVLQAQGRYKEAETLFRKALEIVRGTIGEGRPDYALHLNNLAGVVQAQGRYREAEELHRQALEIVRTKLREGHPADALHLNNLAMVVKSQGRYEEAETLLRRALKIDRATIGERHPSFANDLSNLGHLLRDMDRPDDARPLLEQALAVFENTLPPDHPNITTAKAALASLPNP